MTLYDTPMEWVFVSVSVLALLGALAVLIEAHLDAVTQEALHVNGEAKMMAESGRDQAWAFVLQAFFMLAASILGLFFPPPPPPYELAPQTLIWLIAWILVAAAKFLGAVLNILSRRRLRGLVALDVHKVVGKIRPEAGATLAQVAEQADAVRDSVDTRHDKEAR